MVARLAGDELRSAIKVKINKKSIIIFVSLVTTVISVLLIVNYLNILSVEKYSKQFKEITINNSWAKEEDYKSCNKKPRNCIILASSFIHNGLSMKIRYIDYDSQKFKEATVNIDGALTEKKYKEALSKTDGLVKDINIKLDNYIKENQTNLDQIDLLLYGQNKEDSVFANINYQIVNNWAMVVMSSDNQNLGNVQTILKKTNGVWGVVINPSTIFEKDITSTYPDMPKSFVDDLYYIPGVVIINEKGKKPKSDNTLEYIKKASVDPLGAYLPYVADNYSIKSSTINGLIFYTVTIASDSKEAKKKFQEFINNTNTFVSESRIIFK